MPPRRMWPNSSSLSLALLSPPPSLAPSATTTMEKFTPRVRWRRMMCSQTRSISMGFSGIRITSAPPAIPEWVAIQPACRPITSQTITRLCDSAVEWSRSMASVAICTAGSKPKVRSVPERSLSMVFGTPTTFTPIEESLVATPSVSSPPIATTAPTLRFFRLRITMSGPFAGFLNGLVREVPRMVPPRWSVPLVASRVRRSCSGGSSRPRHPSRIPITSSPCCSPLRTTARITALRPGQSPPPVSTAIFIETASSSRRPPMLRPDFPAAQEHRSVRKPRAASRKPSGVEPSPRDHHQRSQEEVLLGVGLAGAAAPGGPFEPLAREHLSVVGEAAEQGGIAARQVALQQRPEQGLEALLTQARVAAVGIELAVEPRSDVQQLVQERGHALLGGRSAEELRTQRDAIQRPPPLDRHSGAAAAAERTDGRAGPAARLAGDEEDARGADVGELRQGAHHVGHHAAAQKGGVGTLRASRAHLGDGHLGRLRAHFLLHGSTREGVHPFGAFGRFRG